MRDFRWSKWQWHWVFFLFWGLWLGTFQKSNAFRKSGSVGHGSTVTSCSVGARPVHQSKNHLYAAASGNCVWYYTIRSVTNLGMVAVCEVPLPNNLSAEWRSSTAECCEFKKKNLALLSQTMTCSLAAARTAQRVTYWSMAVVWAGNTQMCVCVCYLSENVAWLLKRNGGGGGGGWGEEHEIETWDTFVIGMKQKCVGWLL